MSRSSFGPLIARKPMFILAVLLLAMFGAWQLGMRIPDQAHGSAVRSALLVDLLVIVPLMLALLHKVRRDSNGLSAGQD